LGQIASTSSPRAPIPVSCARFRTSAFTPALLIRYGARPPAFPGPDILPRHAEKITTRPLRASAIGGTSSLTTINVESKLIDQTVEDISKISFDIVKSEPKYSKYLDLIDNFEYINKHNELRKKYFLPIRPIDFYTDELVKNGFKITEVKTINIDAKVDEWFDFLKVYHEGVIGWVGGSKKITGIEPTEQEINERIEIIRLSLNKMFNGQNNFKACWNYIICEKI
jgi:hypothetical protein